MNILGIETSCDETAAAVVANGQTILSNIVASQVDLHKEFGGVVPEIASRSHIEVILQVIDKAITEAISVDSRQETGDSKKAQNQSTDSSLQTPRFDPWDQIDAIAVTYGPGLPGALLVGTLTARTLALIKQKPLYGVNHVLAHVYANFIREQSGVPEVSTTGHGRSRESAKNRKKEIPNSRSTLYRLPSTEPEFPILALIVSGGHTQLVLFKKHFDYKLLGQTQDDAVGEAFDKVAKMLGLDYPGGPPIAKAALRGQSSQYQLPEVFTEGKYDFSFSGLKTAVLRHLQKLIGEDFSFPSFKIAQRLSRQQINDTAASFQTAAVTYLVDKTLAAYQEFSPKAVVIAGGVAANQTLREELGKKLPIKINYAPPELCTDNAAMIAALGYFMAKSQEAADPLVLETDPSLGI